MTFLGSLIWDGAWCPIGYQLGSSWKSIVTASTTPAPPAGCAGGDSGGAFLRAPVAVLHKGATALERTGAQPAQGGHFAGDAAADDPVTGPPAVRAARFSPPGPTSGVEPVTHRQRASRRPGSRQQRQSSTAKPGETSPRPPP